jgi:hypothetical protein
VGAIVGTSGGSPFSGDTSLFQFFGYFGLSARPSSSCA